MLILVLIIQAMPIWLEWIQFLYSLSMHSMIQPGLVSGCPLVVLAYTSVVSLSSFSGALILVDLDLNNTLVEGVLHYFQSCFFIFLISFMDLFQPSLFGVLAFGLWLLLFPLVLSQCLLSSRWSLNIYLLNLIVFDNLLLIVCTTNFHSNLDQNVLSLVAWWV